MRKLIIVTLACSLAGCASLPGPLGDAVKLLTTTVTNPVTETDIYRVKNTYAATLEVAAEYRRYCWSKPYVEILADPVAKPICSQRRAVVRGFQKAQINASATLVAAENFIRDNPTIGASNFVEAAFKAVADFRAAVPVTK